MFNTRSALGALLASVAVGIVVARVTAAHRQLVRQWAYDAHVNNALAVANDDPLTLIEQASWQRLEQQLRGGRHA